MQVNSYPSIYNLGHKAIQQLFTGNIVVQEKVDGSQISFSKQDGEVFIRSKGKQIYIDNPEKLFEKAVTAITSLSSKLEEGFIYRGEYLQKPKHNVLCYDRVPENHIIIFDIEQKLGSEDYLSYTNVFNHTSEIGLECVPTFYQGEAAKVTLEVLEEFLKTKSVLGNVLIEGVVIKNYERFGSDKSILMGKFVAPDFKERHNKDWKKNNPGHGDVLAKIIEEFKTEARWQKAIIHLQEKGELENSPRDIGKLLKEIQQDTLKECEDDIKHMLWKWGWPKIGRGITAGFPEWYKNKLAKEQFNNKG